jgi:molybdate/tungstate transport system substrate-binding protein
MKWSRAFAALGIAVSALAGCGGSSKHGSVNVLYAGSLVNVMQKRIGPDFHTSTGYSLVGFSAGSDALANQIKGKVRAGDVFVSASPKVNSSLEGAANGNWVRWYATFATSALVLGYNPSSTFVSAIRSEPWYAVVTQPGFRLGTTDPATDPKGKLAVEALHSARLSTSVATTYPEETLVGRLQAGQLDAGFFYASEAKAAGIPTVPLAGVDLKATYTVTVLSGAPDKAGAEAFVSFLLGPVGRSALGSYEFHLVTPPKLAGDTAVVPSVVQKAITSG